MHTTPSEPDPQLVPFIAAAKAAGTADGFVLDLLKASGWSERRIFAAFATFYATRLGQPVPVRGTRLEYARDGFLYLLAFISLGCWATGVGHLFFVLIDQWFPSTLDTTFAVASIRQNVSLELATIIVAFPISLFVNTLIGRQLAARPESADSGVRKWLTYVALVIAAIILLTDAICFLQSFLHGDLTARFILDTLVLFAIVGTIFGYYLQALRSTAADPLRDRLFAGLSGAAVALALACGFSSIGLPNHQRDLSFDDRRVNDLALIAGRIVDDYRTTSQLPLRPTALDDVRDPLTRAGYRYVRLDATHYRLCADFASTGSGDVHPAFSHPASRTCFRFSAESALPLGDAPVRSATPNRRCRDRGTLGRVEPGHEAPR